MSDGFWDNEELNERFVAAWEGIAKALEGLHDEAKRAGNRYWPCQREQREAIISRVETDEEREKKLQGAWRRTAEEITDPDAEEGDEVIGERPRQWLRDNPPEKVKAAGSKTGSAGEEGGASPEAAEDKA